MVMLSVVNFVQSFMKSVKGWKFIFRNTQTFKDMSDERNKFTADQEEMHLLLLYINFTYHASCSLASV